jgi:DNA-binding response OmpR family regulator
MTAFHLLQEIVWLADQPARRLGDLGREAVDPTGLKQHTPKILVVDDHTLIADTVAEILNQNGFHAFVAYSGEQALELVQKFIPDYLLSDVLMPAMNGVDLAIAVRKALPSTKILLFSGQANTTELLEKSYEQGYDFDLLAKPIHPEQLIATIRKLK